MRQRILVVDDDPHIREVICFALEAAGMQVAQAPDGAEALAAFEREAVDLIILDVSMPELDGLEVCRRVRKRADARADTPILFLSARGDEIDRVVGLELGGDDYVVKPFSPRELTARVGAILKRAAGKPDGVAPDCAALEWGALRLDAARFAAEFAGIVVALTAIEFDMVRALAARPGVVFNREQIMAAAYPENLNVSDRTIDSHIRNIRAKFASVGCASAIETVHGVGFRAGAFARADG
jgi:two-component system OmpR family response regulator